MIHSRRLAVLFSTALAVGAIACDQGSSDTTDAPGASGGGKAAAQSGSKGGKSSELPFHATGPVAKVDGEPISAAAYNKEVRRLQRMVPMLPPQMAEQYKGKVLDSVISKKLLDKAIEDAGVEVDAGDVKAKLGELEAMVKSKSGKGMSDFYKRTGMDQAGLQEQIKSSLALEQILARDHDVEVKDKELKDFYDKHPEQFEQKSKMRARHILLKVPKDASEDKAAKVEKKAKELAQKAQKDGADFAALAKEHSEGPSASKGGDLGYFGEGRMVPKFSKAASKLKAGEVSDPVRTRFGFHVIKLEDRKKARTIPFSEAKTDIAKRMEKQKLRSATKKFVKKLRSKASIEKMEQNIEVNASAGQQAPRGLPPGLQKQLQQRAAPKGKGGGSPSAPAGKGSKSMQLKMPKLGGGDASKK